MLTIEENDRPDFERLKQELEQDPCINCNVCFKIKFIKTMFKYSQTEYLCQECLQGVEVFEERKLWFLFRACDVCKSFLNEKGGCVCLKERCLICKRERHPNISCSDYKVWDVRNEKKVYYVCKCSYLLSLVEGSTWFFCKSENSFYCLVCLKKFEGVHRECLVLFNYPLDYESILSSKRRSF